MLFRDDLLKEKVALVTGGGTGIGRQIAIDIAKAGAKIIIVSRNAKSLLETADEIKKFGHAAIVRPTNVVQKPDVDRMIASVYEVCDRIDILVNCAGGSARDRSSLFCDSTEEVWDDIIALNYKGVLNVTHSVISKMISQKYGRIINISSLDGVIGAAGRADYSGAKAAVIGFSNALAKEVAQHGITVNCVSPGPIVSGYDEIMLSSNSPESQKWVTQMGAVTGFGYGEKTDISSIVTFLASDSAKFISGQNYSVCGLANINPSW